MEFLPRKVPGNKQSLLRERLCRKAMGSGLSKHSRSHTIPLHALGIGMELHNSVFVALRSIYFLLCFAFICLHSSLLQYMCHYTLEICNYFCSFHCASIKEFTLSLGWNFDFRSLNGVETNKTLRDFWRLTRLRISGARADYYNLSMSVHHRLLFWVPSSQLEKLFKVVLENGSAAELEKVSHCGEWNI